MTTPTQDQDCRSPGFTSEYLRLYPEHSDLVRLAKGLIDSTGSADDFSQTIGAVVRRAFDEVIDMPRTARWTIAQLEKTEKTYIGTKVEILLRHELGLSRGKKLDLIIDGQEVDIKNTIGNNWPIPLEAVDEICLIISGKWS